MQDKIQQLRKQLIKKAKKQVQVRYAESDVHIIRAVSLLQDLDAGFNLLAENCIEWYSAHFPELHNIVKDNETYLKLVQELGDRANFTEKNAAEIIKERERRKRVLDAAKKSMGSEIQKDVLEAIKMLSKNALSLKKERLLLESLIGKQMQGYAPNTAGLAGPILGARLIAAASGLKQLAMMPASTIQLLGAEKALFRHIRDRKIKGPKYGHIYGHALVKKQPAKHKGKVARSLAGKLSIAARADYFHGENISEKLKQELEERAKQLD
ncbi:MAG: NOP58 family protein [Candidatus Diapherotrites archaeon]|uniref:NOP58 family protein n=1 Tax=Candidatus Iainarchaeum sp. TaxID=3101447 RepID=A0A938YNT6_9ARCH|nr:NOP58 family protein [Candidatus Diapherotrites archaeon]